MSNFGKAFRTVRLIKDITSEQAATRLGIDERSLRDIETGKTTLVAQRFEQLLSFYNIPIQVIFDLASDQASLQNIVNEVKQNATGMIFNQNGALEKELYSQLDKRVAYLEAQNQVLLGMVKDLLQQGK